MKAVNPKLTDTVLAGLAGYVDTLSFVALFGLFTAHVTGNFVLIGAALAGFGKGVFLKLVVFPAFIAGVSISSVLVRSQPPSLSARAARLLYALQAISMIGFCAAGVLASPIESTRSAWVLAAGILGTFSMGIQNAHSRLILRPGVPNTVMTGNVTQAVLDAVDMIAPNISVEMRLAARERFAKMLPAIAAFACGAIGGAWAYRSVGFWALMLPSAVLAFFAVLSNEHPRSGA